MGRVHPYWKTQCIYVVAWYSEFPLEGGTGGDALTLFYTKNVEFVIGMQFLAILAKMFPPHPPSPLKSTPNGKL